MQEKHLFEYAIVRVVPRVEREEFLNTGVILYCKSTRFLATRYTLDTSRLCAFDDAADIEEIRLHLDAFDQICQGNIEAGPIAKLDPAARFRWLTATRSTIIQTSKVHPGLCTDPLEMLKRLYHQMVL